MKFELKWLAWEITRRCNLHCVHCRSSSEFELKEHLDFPTSEAYRILDDIASFTKPVVVLSGGEPLLRADVFEIAQHGTDKGLRMCLATNGTLVTPEVCGKIKDAGIRMVSLSLDGATAEVHDNFRQQPGAFEGTLRAARFLKEYGIDFLINSSFTKRNQVDIPKVYRLAKGLGATAWYMFMIVPTGRGEDILEELISPKDYEQILDWHYEMEKDEDELLVRPTCAPHYYRVRLQKAKAEGERVKHRTLKFSTGGAKGCLAGQLIALIDVDGNVLPCSYFPLPAGNIRQQSLREIWQGSPLFKELRDFESYKGRCGVCEYLSVCGGCRARVYAVSGDYLQEEPFCAYRPRRIQEIEAHKETGSMNDIFLRACHGERTVPTPIWIMRQAGRYLPAYQEVRGKTDFLTLCKTPELAAKVTLQPVDILGVDAAILFSDILIPLEPMGVRLAFHEGRGPVIEPPIQDEAAVNALRPIDPAADVPFVLETIRILRRELAEKVPLIGFSGGPFTLATYLIEGGTSRSFVNTRRMMFSRPDLFAKLMNRIADGTLAYLRAQVEAGAQAVQVFDTWAGILSPEDYSAWVLPYVRRILKGLAGVPKIYFVYDGCHLLELIGTAGADVVGLDWRMDLRSAISRLGPEVVVQGNLDPCALFMSAERLRERVVSILRQGQGAKAHIFNLGHGVLPEIPPEQAKLLVDIVHGFSSLGEH